MNILQLAPKAKVITLLVAGILIFVVSTYTKNSGLQLAGALIFLIGGILAFNLARGGNGSS